MQGDGARVSESEINVAIAKRRRRQDWNVILPEISQLTLSTDGSGIPISMKIAKDATMAFKIAKQGDVVEGTLLKQEIDPWSVFNLGRDELAKKLAISRPRTLALIFELRLQDDKDCYRELRRKSQLIKGYSQKALNRLRDALETIDMDDVWARHKAKLTGRR